MLYERKRRNGKGYLGLSEYRLTWDLWYSIGRYIGPVMELSEMEGEWYAYRKTGNMSMVELQTQSRCSDIA